MDATEDDNPKQIGALMTTPNLATALDSEPVRHFLDQMPIAIIMSDMQDGESIVYANPEFTRLTGYASETVLGQPWARLGGADTSDSRQSLGGAIADASDYVGTFAIPRDGATATLVDAYANVIEDDSGTHCYRLAALINVSGHSPDEREALAQRLREKDTQLWEIQHRVKNNLQMITALIGLEARQARGKMDTAPFDRLSGRVASIQILYSLLSDHAGAENIDLGMYLSRIAASVLQAHSAPGIRLNMQVDNFIISVNVALPAGLVVNELLTNSLKHAFADRDGGTIRLQSRLEGDHCQLVIADDGIGLPPGLMWPERTKLSAAIVQTLRVNARAEVVVESQPGRGTKVTITFPVAASP